MANKHMRYGSLDIFKMIAALLVVAIHISPLASFNDTADFLLTRIWARTAVPFFFMVTGFFVLPGCMKSGGGRYLCRQLSKLGILYGTATLLYLPVNIYTGYFKGQGIITKVVKDLLVNGTFYHLWYLPAVMTGLVVVYLLFKSLGFRWTMALALLLYGIGVFGDSYYGVIADIPVIEAVYEGIFSVSEYTRNGLFMAPVFLVMGYILAGTQKMAETQRFGRKECAAGFGVCFVIFNGEGLILHFLRLQRHDSMYFFLIPVMFFLFQLLLLVPVSAVKIPKDLPMYIYILHPLCIILVRGGAKVLKATEIFVDMSCIHYLLVAALTVIVSITVIKVKTAIKKVVGHGKSLDRS